LVRLVSPLDDKDQNQNQEQEAGGNAEVGDRSRHCARDRDRPGAAKRRACTCPKRSSC